MSRRSVAYVFPQGCRSFAEDAAPYEDFDGWARDSPNTRIFQHLLHGLGGLDVAIRVVTSPQRVEELVETDRAWPVAHALPVSTCFRSLFAVQLSLATY